MVKYSPKENTYKEMYLINKFERDIMENTLQNMRNDKTKNSQKFTTENIAYPDDKIVEVETPDKKTSDSLPEKHNRKSNENGNMDIPEVINSAIEKGRLNDVTLSDNGNTPVQRVDTTPMSPIKTRKKVTSTKLGTPEIKNKLRKISKRVKKDQLEKQRKVLMDQVFQNWKV